MTIEKLKKQQGLTNDDIVETIKADYPKFNKSTLSMAMHPDDYGVKLLPKCSKTLNEKYGVLKPSKAPQENNRISLTLNPKILAQLKSVSLSENKTVSAVVIAILEEHFNEQT